mmetsp:Transcript_51997/g.97527  ORF Transcript_51997/g.97527 Transcript_51997/m.97527 type:complete len:338 (+) Transcript_51997:54-1067(+)
MTGLRSSPIGLVCGEVAITIEQIEKRAAEINRQTCRGWGMGWGMFIGIAYSFFICYMQGRYPQYFWLVYLVSFVVLAPLTFQAYKKIQQQGAFKEFCWYANIMGNVAVLLSLLIRGSRDIHVSTALPKFMFTLAWAPATGVLLIMTIVNGNQLSFNHLPTIGETFIHLFPTLVMYSMRWHNKEVMDSYPQFFDFHYMHDIDNLDIFVATACLYAPWWLGYTFWAMMKGVCSPADKTFFHQQMRMVRGLPFRRYYSQHEHPVRLDVFLYMLGHAVWVIALSLVSMLAFHWKPFHLFINGIALLRVTLLGALRYGKILAYYQAVKSFKSSDESEMDSMG